MNQETKIALVAVALGAALAFAGMNAVSVLSGAQTYYPGDGILLDENLAHFALARQHENDVTHNYFAEQGLYCACTDANGHYTGEMLSMDDRFVGGTTHAQLPVCDNGRQWVPPTCVSTRVTQSATGGGKNGKTQVK